MQADVHFEAPRRGEALQAVLALEGLDARVRLDVRGQGALHGEGPEALRALEGLLVRVDADVAHQVAGLAELLGAVGTHVPPDPVLLADGPGQKWGLPLHQLLLLSVRLLWALLFFLRLRITRARGLAGHMGKVWVLTLHGGALGVAGVAGVCCSWN